MGSRLRMLVAAAVVLAAAACTSKKPAGKLEPKLSSIQEHVFDRHCVRSACHDTYTPESQLVLTQGKAYTELIGKPSTVVRNRFRVVPFRSSESYLVDKLTGYRIVGERMPLGRPKLPDSTIAMIRRWIDEGALQN